MENVHDFQFQFNFRCTDNRKTALLNIKTNQEASK